MTSAFPGGLKAKIRKIHADGESVIVELVNRGTAATGKAYENEYCFVFEISTGKIRAIREYVDLEKAKIALTPQASRLREVGSVELSPRIRSRPMH